MKTGTLFVSIIALVALPSMAAELKWFKGDIDKALDSAKKENKIVMIDFFADWCMPCKMLDKMVWQDEEASAEIKSMSVIPMKLDAEKEGVKSAEKYRIRAYPTILFLNKEGKEISRTSGFRDKSDILELIRKNCGDSRSIDEIRAVVEKNKDDLAIGLELAQKLVRTGEKREIEEAKKILESVYRADPDNKRGFGARAMMMQFSIGIGELGNEIRSISRFSRPVNGEKKVAILWDKEPVDFTDFYRSVNFVVQGAKDAKAPLVEKVLKDACDQMKAYSGTDCGFEMEPLMDLHMNLDGREWQGVKNALGDIAMLFAENASANVLNEIAWANYAAQRRLEDALVLSRKSCEKSKDPNLMDTKAHLLMALGHKEEAIELERTAIEELEKKGDTKSAEVFLKVVRNFENDLLDGLDPGVEPADKSLKKAD